jgi:hypothetical protein
MRAARTELRPLTPMMRIEDVTISVTFDGDSGCEAPSVPPRGLTGWVITVGIAAPGKTAQA